MPGGAQPHRDPCGRTRPDLCIGWRTDPLNRSRGVSPAQRVFRGRDPLTVSRRAWLLAPLVLKRGTASLARADGLLFVRSPCSTGTRRADRPGCSVRSPCSVCSGSVFGVFGQDLRSPAGAIARSTARVYYNAQRDPKGTVTPITSGSTARRYRRRGPSRSRAGRRRAGTRYPRWGVRLSGPRVRCVRGVRSGFAEPGWSAHGVYHP